MVTITKAYKFTHLNQMINYFVFNINCCTLFCFLFVYLFENVMPDFVSRLSKTDSKLRQFTINIFIVRR